MDLKKPDCRASRYFGGMAVESDNQRGCRAEICRGEFFGWLDNSIWKWSDDEGNLIDEVGSLPARECSGPALDIGLAR